MNFKYTILILILVLITIWSCRKEDDENIINPYDNPGLLPPKDTTADPKLDSGSFQFLYHKVFAQTCANSGCHDGNFPPDFRTIYSSYNTLVNHPVITNDAQNKYTYRVQPFNSDLSLLYARLTIDIPNTSGMMPAVVDPGSDWPDHKVEYIQMIKDWIDAGAPDTYGNIPGETNLKPQVIGILAFNSGSTSNPLQRLDSVSTNPIIIPKGPIDIWMAFDDDNTDPADFASTVLKSSRELFNFDSAEDFNLSKVSAITGPDFWGQTASFKHKATLNFPSDTSNTFIYLRSYIQEDDSSEITEMPNNGTSEILRSYFTLKVDSL